MTASAIVTLMGSLIFVKNFPPISGQVAHNSSMPHGLGPCSPGVDGKMTYEHRVAVQELRSVVGRKVPCVNNVASSYPCRNIDLESFLSASSLTGTGNAQFLNDIWGWTNPDTGVDYAIVGMDGGTSFIDLSNPNSPEVIGYLPTRTVSSSWRDIKTFKNHAFIVSEASDHGMQVFDMMQLTDLLSFSTLEETASYTDHSLGNAHNVFINEDSDVAYVVGATSDDCSAGGLHMVDISDPSNPNFAGCFSGDGYTHDVQCVNYDDGPDGDYLEKEICFASNENDVAIIDVTDKSNARVISKIRYPNPGYTHQGWLTEDKKHFLIDDETDELCVFGGILSGSKSVKTRTIIADVSNLDSPNVVGIHEGSSKAIDHNLYVKGNYVYQANYRAGLRVLDLSSVADGTLTEKAYFDVYPGSDSNEFNGAWSNYPFFDSGIVVVSGIEQGLFVLRVNFDFPDGGGDPDDTGCDRKDGEEGKLIKYFLRQMGN